MSIKIVHRTSISLQLLILSFNPLTVLCLLWCLFGNQEILNGLSVNLLNFLFTAIDCPLHLLLLFARLRESILPLSSPN